jgi:glutamyl-tRNA synthetase
MGEVVRVRFAPSPTGAPHIGNIRTALFNWLFARHHNGVFILRIEDTDVARLVEGAVEAIKDALRWLGLDWDEGPDVGGPFAPYVQSQRLPIYREHARMLVEKGNAYLCYCSRERLAKMRKEQRKRGEAPRYDRRCRDLSDSERAEFEREGITPVVRLKIPLGGETTFHDLIRGDITFQNEQLDDFVLLKSDGYPTYHLANVVDDHIMEITHVLRADEWIPSTPRHVLLYKAFGWEPPNFAHLPMILGPDRSKLSKRHGATSIESYREQGFLPEAIINFLALLGWSYDDRTEIFNRDGLISHFSLKRVGKTPSIFNVEKLTWMNGVYIRKLEEKDLAERIVPFLAKGIGMKEEELRGRKELIEIIPLIRERIKRLKDIVDMADFFFVEEITYEPELLIGKKMTAEESLWALTETRDVLEALPDFDSDTIEIALRSLADELGLKTGQLFGIIRVAATGKKVAPPLFGTLSVLGKERVLKRIGRAIKALKSVALLR